MALWNKASRSTVATDKVEEVAKRQPLLQDGIRVTMLWYGSAKIPLLSLMNYVPEWDFVASMTKK